MKPQKGNDLFSLFCNFSGFGHREQFAHVPMMSLNFTDFLLQPSNDICKANELNEMDFYLMHLLKHFCVFILK